MRIVTWNAHMAFRNKQKNLVERLDPDVAVIQECEDPDKYPGMFPKKLFEFRIWRGENKNKGIAVFSKYKIIELDKKSPTSRFYIPFKVNDIFFIGIWAMNDKEKNPTYYHLCDLYNKKRHYHTDYIFLKKNNINTIKIFSVGQYNEWKSDHMPLFIEI